MKFAELNGLIIMKSGNEFSTYEANEFLPRMSTQQVASLLRRDERIAKLDKKWYWFGSNHWKKVSVWKVNRR